MSTRDQDLNNIMEMYNLYKNNSMAGQVDGSVEGPNIKHFLDILSSSRRGNSSFRSDSDFLSSLLNQSLEDYDYPSLEAVDPPLQILLIVMYSLTAVLSLTGNTTAIIVLTFGRR